MKTLRFGIEIETVGLSRTKLAEAIHSVVGGTISNDYRDVRITTASGRTWKVVPDGSLSGGENSGEIVSPVLGYDDIDELQNVVRAVRTAGAKADPSTGIHIHIDGSRFDAKSVTNLVKLVHKQERLLEHALGVSETRLSRYCRPIDASFIQRLEARRPKTMQEVSDAWYGYRNTSPQRYDQTRYHGLNLNSLFFRGTIELRYFNGTLHGGEGPRLEGRVEQAPRVQPGDRQVRLPGGAPAPRAHRRRVQDRAPAPHQEARGLGGLEGRAPRPPPGRERPGERGGGRCPSSSVRGSGPATTPALDSAANGSDG